MRAGWVVGFHAGKVLLPTRLAFFYPSWTVDTSDWTLERLDHEIASIRLRYLEILDPLGAG